MHHQIGINAQTLKKDIPAGLVVFLVALPLCLGISLASGAPLFSGILTGIVGGLLVSWLSGSSLSVSGPAAGLTVIVLDGIKELKSFETFLLAGFIAGVLQLGLGYCKAGLIGMYVPSSVIRGMLAAIGLTLILKQLPHFIGIDREPITEEPLLPHDGHNPFGFLPDLSGQVLVGSCIIGLVSLGILILWENKRIKSIPAFKLVPGALIVVITSIFMNLGFAAYYPAWKIAPTHLVNLPIFTSVGEIGKVMTMPDWSQWNNTSVYIVAFTIAVIASLETLLSIEAVDKIDPHRRETPPNRELMAQGAGNMVASLIGGIPLTSVIVRSSANVDSGGQTRMSSFVHGILLLLSVLFLARWINLVPLSALAAVLLVVGFKLTKPALYRAQYKLGWDQFIPFIVTIVGVLMTDLLIGVAAGLMISVFFILKASYESSHFLHEEKHDDEHVIRIELSENVSFLNKAAIARVLEDLPDGYRVLLDGTKSTYIDYDVLEAIQNYKILAADRDIRLELINVPEVVAVAH
ncbi:SulP family inorganic anion transporter [bacterium]|nr:MAG: SulP family inorganic anion transporter [bacterium]